jgi:hypothetical protein
VVLRTTDKYGVDGAREIIWEHGRRNMEMQADGLMPIVQAGIMSYTVHACRGFPGSALPPA